MEEKLLRDTIKDFIPENGIKAACFFSYNFDAEFFENYILPLFIKDAPFNDNKIHNSILWRKYCKQLPTVSVICDFHAKGVDAPTLPYQVVTKDFKRVNGHKSVFHPKCSFILNKKNQLLVITGSNNLTYSGWCRNIEGINIDIFENGVDFPREYKDNFRDYLYDVGYLDDGIDALQPIYRFFYQKKYTKNIKQSFWYSDFSSFNEFLDDQINEEIDKIEIISPYIYGKSHLIYLKELCDDINIAIPFEASNVAGISLETFNELKSKSIVWSLISSVRSKKDFRFNHSKIYRFKGQNKMYTIVGSVNLTEMAWKGVKDNGNWENATLYVEDVNKWVNLLEPFIGNPEDVFRFSDPTEKDVQRHLEDVPSIIFTLDWLNNILCYENNEQQSAKWLLSDGNKLIKPGDGLINLTTSQITELAQNPLIKLSYNGSEFYFYAQQLNVELKPLPARLRLSNKQLFDLWNELIDTKGAPSNNDLLNSLIQERIEDAGEWIEDKQPVSILNQMASHLSGILTLEKALFPKNINHELISYYLIVNNIDTISGYTNLLRTMQKEESINPGFHWLLLKIIELKLFNRAIKIGELDDLKETLKKKRKEIAVESKEIEKSLTKIDKQLFNWVRKQI